MIRDFLSSATKYRTSVLAAYAKAVTGPVDATLLRHRLKPAQKAIPRPPRRPRS